jgi:hypothetical protein
VSAPDFKAEAEKAFAGWRRDGAPIRVDVPGSIKTVEKMLHDAYKLGRRQGFREAASAVHCLRPSETDHIGGNRYVHDVVYPHVLNQFVKDRDTIVALVVAAEHEGT